MTKIVTNIEDDEWDDFVFRHPLGNIHQTRAMYDIYAGTKNHNPLKFFAINEITNEIEGVLSAVIIREMGGVLGDFSARSIIQGGPIVSDNSTSILSKLIAEYDKLAKKKCLYSEVRNVYDVTSFLQSLTNYKYEDHLNFWIHLNRSEDEIWKNIQKPRRKNINRATKKGVIIEKMEDKELMPTFYELLQQTYANVKIPLADITLFESAFDHLHPKNMVKFFLAKHDDIYIGARAILTYKNCIHDWYAGTSMEALSLYPNDLLVWHILKWGRENNYTVFDFGGAGKPDEEYGPREFKRRFGGELVNYGRYAKIHAPIKTNIAKLGFEVYRRIVL